MLGKNSCRNPGDSGSPGGGPKTGGPMGSEEEGGSVSRNPFLKNLTHKTRRDGDKQPCSNRSNGQNTRVVLRARMGGRWTQTQSRKAEKKRRASGWTWKYTQDLRKQEETGRGEKFLSQ